MRFLLDTNVVSELRRANSPRANPRFVTWAKTLSVGEAISAITIFELEIGVRRIERRDPAQGVRLRRWLESVKAAFGDTTLPVDAEVANLAATFHVPDPASDRDAFIAVTAAVHGLTVVTRNTADFATFGVALLDPWEA